MWYILAHSHCQRPLAHRWHWAAIVKSHQLFSIEVKVNNGHSKIFHGIIWSMLGIVVLKKGSTSLPRFSFDSWMYNIAHCIRLISLKGWINVSMSYHLQHCLTGACIIFSAVSIFNIFLSDIKLWQSNLIHLYWISRLPHELQIIRSVPN